MEPRPTIRVEDTTEVLSSWTRMFEYEHTGRWKTDTFANYFLKSESATEEAMSAESTMGVSRFRR